MYVVVFCLAFFNEMKIFGQRNYISSTLWCLMDLLRMTESFLEKIFRSVVVLGRRSRILLAK